MLQVVFGDSEKGAIICALHFSNNAGEYPAIAVIHSGDGEPTQDEQERAIAQYRLQWEREQLRGKPLGGNREDIIGISASLDIGDIDCSPISDSRLELITQMFLADPWAELSGAEDIIKPYWDGCTADYEALIKRAKAGESVRIWYSSSPSSLCGFYCVLYELADFDCQVTAIRLPEWIPAEEGVKSSAGWGEVSPGDWAGYLPLETEISKPARVALAEVWSSLKKENAPLRASVNGRLHSVGADFYDVFIRQEIPDGTFKVAQLIGKVLGRRQPGIGDWLISQRINHMIESGELYVFQENPGFYDCVLKRAL